LTRGGTGSGEQALSRAYRIGQRNKVFVYRFISKNTIEDKIKDLQEEKSLLAKSSSTVIIRSLSATGRN
jgi:SNF2 family DNA or RNA helicase